MAQRSDYSVRHAGKHVVTKGDPVCELGKNEGRRRESGEKQGYVSDGFWWIKGIAVVLSQQNLVPS